MHLRVAVIYNQPGPSRYYAMNEQKAVLGVLEAAKAVSESLSGLGHEIALHPLVPPINTVAGKLQAVQADLVFNLFEGFDGQPETEADIADLLTTLKQRYTGCPGPALRLALDKAASKQLLQAAGIPTPAHQLLDNATLEHFHLTYPCIVKPCAEDASHGISEKSVVNDDAGLAAQVAEVCSRFGGQALVEEFIDGPEINASVLGEQVLPPSEIAYALPAGLPRLLTYSAKWETDSVYYRGTKPICPARLDARRRQEIEDLSRRAFVALGCRGYARVDLRLDGAGRPFVLEVNPNPDISPGAGAARQAEAAGMDYLRFIERIALLGLEGED